jgi:hypothetical protein
MKKQILSCLFLSLTSYVQASLDDFQKPHILDTFENEYCLVPEKSTITRDVNNDKATIDYLFNTVVKGNQTDKLQEHLDTFPEHVNCSFVYTRNVYKTLPDGSSLPITTTFTKTLITQAIVYHNPHNFNKPNCIDIICRYQNFDPTKQSSCFALPASLKYPLQQTYYKSNEYAFRKILDRHDYRQEQESIHATLAHIQLTPTTFPHFQKRCIKLLQDKIDSK